MLATLTDADLLKSFAALLGEDRRTTARLLAHIAEIDARHLYLREGFESMQGYCMAALHLTEHAAMKRIQIARLSRQFPALLAAIADGRLHLGSARVIATHLTESNVVDLIEKAANRTVVQVEILVARLFPEAEPLRLDDGISPQPSKNRLATWHVDFQKSTPQVRTKIAPIAQRFTLQVSISGAVNDKLRRAQELLSHALPSGNVEQVLERALDSLIERLEKRKFGNANAPPRQGGTRRAIPSQIRALVYKRDGGRCTKVYEDGRRCEATTRLEFDHIVPLAKGGRTTVENLRLLCRPHNQAEAERAFGREFMESKRRTPCKSGS